MSIQVISNVSSNVSRSILQFLQSGDDLPSSSGFLNNNSSLFWISQQNRIVVVDSLNGSKISAYQFSAETVIVAVSPFSLEENSPGLYLVTENGDENSRIFCFHVASSRIIGEILNKNRIVSVSTIKDFSTPKIDCLNWHYALRDSNHLLAVGTNDGHAFIINPQIRYKNEFSSKETIHLTSSDLESAVPNSSFSIDFVSFLHSQSNFFWTDDCYSSTIDSDTVAVTSIKLINEADLIAIGFNFGSFLLVSLKNGRHVFCSSYDDCFCPVVHFLVQEPENDPRPTLFLWIVRNDGSSRGFDQSAIVSPTLFQLLSLSFRKKNYNRQDGSLYEDLEICIPKFHWSPENCVETIFCDTLSVDRSISDRFDVSNATEIDEPDRSLTYFLWKTLSDDVQGVLFDINAWYHAQMPNTYSLKSNSNGIYMAFHSFPNLTDKSIAAAQVQSRSVQRCRDFEETESTYYASNVSLNLILCNNQSIWICKADSLLNNAIEKIDKSGPKLFLNPKDVVDLVDESGLFPALNVSPNTNKEIRWAIYDAMLYSKRLKFLNDCLIEFREDAILLTDFIDWSWNRVKRWKESFQIRCDRALDVSSGGVSPSDKKSMHRSKLMIDYLFSLHRRCSECFLDVGDNKERSNELSARRDAISLIALYIRMVLWFVDENLIALSGGLHFRHFKTVSIEKNQSFIDKLIKKLNETADFCSSDSFARLEFPPKSFQELLNVYLSPNIDDTTKHALIFYNLLMLRDSSLGKNEIEIGQICDRFCSNFLSFSKTPLARLISGFWHHDNGDLETASKYFSEAALGADSFENAHFWFKIFPFENVSPTVFQLISTFTRLFSKELTDRRFATENVDVNDSETDKATLKTTKTLTEKNKLLAAEKNFFLGVTRSSVITAAPPVVAKGAKLKPLALSRLSKMIEPDKNVSPLKRHFPSEIILNSSEPSTKKSKFNSSSVKNVDVSMKFDNRDNFKSIESDQQSINESNLMHFEDVRSLLETSKRSKPAHQSLTSTDRKPLPVSILKCGTSPKRLPATQILTDNVLTVPKQFRFDLPVSPETTSSTISNISKIEDVNRNILQERPASIEQPNFDASSSTDEEISFNFKQFPLVSSRPSVSFEEQEEPEEEDLKRPVLTSKEIQNPAKQTIITRYPAIKETSPEFVDREENYLSEESYVVDEPKDNSGRQMAVFFTPVSSKKLSFAEYARNEMDSILKSVHTLDPGQSREKVKEPVVERAAAIPRTSSSMFAEQVAVERSTLTSVRRSPNFRPASDPDASRTIENLPERRFESAPLMDNVQSSSSIAESIATRVKISPRSAKSKFSSSPTRSSEKDDISTTSSDVFQEETSTMSESNRYDLRRRPLRVTDPGRSKRIATPAVPSEFARKLKAGRRISSVRKLKTIPKELLLQYDFSPPQTVEENANLVEEPADVDEMPITFVFSPPITRSRTKSNDTQSQTTPFAEKLRRKSVKKSTRVVKRLTRASLPLNPTD